MGTSGPIVAQMCITGLSFSPGDAKRDHAMAMVVDDGSNVRPGFIKSGVYEALQIRLSPARIHGLPVERELHDVTRFDQFGRYRVRKQEPARIIRVAHAHMAESVHHAFIGQDAIGRDQILDECFKSGHAFLRYGLCARCLLLTALPGFLLPQRKRCRLPAVLSDTRLAFVSDPGLESGSTMETFLDIGAVLIFLLLVPSVVWAVRTEEKDVSAALAAFVAIFVTILGLVFMSAASTLATSSSSTSKWFCSSSLW